MADLIVPTKTALDSDGNVLSITPQSAGWEYIGFDVYSLKKGQKLKKNTENQEICIVILTGKSNVSTKEEKWENIGQRMDIFEKIPPYSVYVSNDDHYAK